MKFVSYAQNFEDVMLMRALATVGEGFYIDVGAAEPSADSVTAAFYERGWRGINIEPMAAPFSRLQEARPLDVNLQLALEDKPGKAIYFSVDGGNGISTGNPNLAKKYKESNWEIAEVPVVVSTLADICKTHVGDKPIHFLKIDVEGRERAVLQGADFSLYRPWIILIEVTLPEEWENILKENDYQFVYFDGLNRFYVAQEKLDSLGDCFSIPPNIFDNFIKSSELSAANNYDEAFAAWKIEKTAREEVEARLALSKAEAEAYYQESFESSRHIAWLTHERVRLTNALQAEQRHVQALLSEQQLRAQSIADIYSSTSWRLTRPIRWFRSAFMTKN